MDNIDHAIAALSDRAVQRPTAEQQRKAMAARLDMPVNQENQLRKQRVPPRNAPCPCGSGQKYKKCHGAPKPNRKLQYKSVTDTYTDKQVEARTDFIKRWGFDPSPAQLATAMNASQQETMEMVIARMEQVGRDKETDYSSYVAAIRKHGFLLSGLNEKFHSDEARKEWLATVRENLPDDGPTEENDEEHGPSRTDG